MPNSLLACLLLLSALLIPIRAAVARPKILSFAPALRGEPSERGPIFSDFPHALPVPDSLRPAITVQDGAWKLYRLFHNGEAGAHEWRLYNMKDNEGERSDLAAQYPDLVAAMDAKIEAYLKHTGAVVPLLNPDYKPREQRAKSSSKQRQPTVDFRQPLEGSPKPDAVVPVL